MTQTEAARS